MRGIYNATPRSVADGETVPFQVDPAGNMRAACAQVITKTATVALGESLSGAVDCSAGRAARISMPAAWDTANLTFQASADGVTYNNLYDSSGTEYTVTAAASRSILLPLVDFISIRYLKIRSGTSGSAVNQTAARTITLVLVP